MRKLLLLLVGVVAAFASHAANFQAGKTYYIDISNVSSWMFKDGRGMYVWDGGKNLNTTHVTGNIYKWIQETDNQNTICVKRCVNKDDDKSDNWWNASNPTSNCVKLGGSNDQIEWYGTDYVDTTAPDWSTTPLYLRGIGGWDATTSNQMTYSNGKFTKTVDNIAVDTQFKIGSGEATSWTHSWSYTSLSSGLSGNAASKLVDAGGADHNFKAKSELNNVTFTFDPAAMTLSVVEDASTPVVTTTPGWTYFVKGNFSNDAWLRLSPSASAGRYTTNISIASDNPDGYLTMLFYGEKTNEAGEVTETKYFASNGQAYGSQSGNYNFDEDNTLEFPINISILNSSKVYTITFAPGDNWFSMTEDNVAHTGYYLSGDINVWSDLYSRHTENYNDAKKNHGYFSGEGEGDDGKGGYFYLQDDPDNPWVRFKSKEEFVNKWRFDFVGPGPEGTSGNNWYRLNLAAKDATDLKGNPGRLGGQFKIIAEYYDDGLKATTANLESTGNGYGINIDTNGDNYLSDDEVKVYWKNVIKIGEKFEGGKKNGGQNFLLDNTVIENAVIWFQPYEGSDKCDVMILGDPKDLYVYYVNEGLTDEEADAFAGPRKTYVNFSDQYNNYPQVNPFRGYSKDSNGNESNVDCTTSAYDFSWHRVEGTTYYDPYGEGSGHAAIPFTKVWRKKIPASIIHRTPMSFLTSVTPYEATGDQWFPAVRIDCEDIWFIENKANINVFLRFADEAVQNSPATQVYFNAWLDQYDADGSLAAPIYLLGDMKNGQMTKISKQSLGETAFNALIDETHRTSNGKELSWFMAPKGIITPDMANASHAMFITAYGGEYPTNFSGASVGDRQSVALNGTDLYYVVGGSSSRVGLLYSHLKGTFVAGDADYIQINAEFFARGHNVFQTNYLNTTIGSEVDYQFSVSKVNDAGQREELLGIDAEKWYDEPYYNWYVADYEPGLYVINVRVRKLVNGSYEYYSSNDIYPIFNQR